MENPTQDFRETNIVLQLEEESRMKSKTVMSWSPREKSAFSYKVYVVRRTFFQHLCFISMYRVLNKPSDDIYCYISQRITSYAFLLIFKIVIAFSESLRKEINIFCCARYHFKKHGQVYEPVINIQVLSSSTNTRLYTFL